MKVKSVFGTRFLECKITEIVNQVPKLVPRKFFWTPITQLSNEYTFNETQSSKRNKILITIAVRKFNQVSEGEFLFMILPHVTLTSK